MKNQDMQEALLKLANEMTSSINTANTCIHIMDLDDDEQLFNIAQYLKSLVYLEQEVCKGELDEDTESSGSINHLMT